MYSLRVLAIGTLVATCLAAGCHPRPAEDDQPVLLPARQPATESTPTENPPGSSQPDLVLEPGQDRTLVGRWPARPGLLDLEEHDTPVRNVVQKFARVSRLNFVLADEVRGRVTVSFKAVPWTRALEAVLQAKGLVAVLQGNVVRILPVEAWRAECTSGD